LVLKSAQQRKNFLVCLSPRYLAPSPFRPRSDLRIPVLERGLPPKPYLRTSK
jgi:hypothetical protein